MRVFIALEPPERVKDNVLRSLEQLKHFATGGRFATREKLHITLHFLGEIPENKLIYVQSAMDGIKNMPAPIGAVTQFVLWRTSAVVCAKIRDKSGLTALHDNLGALLEKNYFDVEHRAYRPHVTVVRNPEFSMPFSEVTKSVDVFNMPFCATDVVLYESKLNKDGATYRELYRVSLPPQEIV